MPATLPAVTDIADLLSDLAQVQQELLDHLRTKHRGLSQRRPEEVSQLQDREQELGDRLRRCHDRRSELLTQAKNSGLPSDSITSLAETLPGGKQPELKNKIREASQNVRLLQHACLSNWVVAQQSLLHVSQLLEIIATGGRLQPTYGDRDSATARGSLLNGEA